MITVALKNRLQALEERKNVKRELPWDCKNLFDHYRSGDLHSHFQYFFNPELKDKIRPVYRLVIEDQQGLSMEAREFLSLSAEGQARVVDQNTPRVSENEGKEITQRILDRLDRIANVSYTHLTLPT